MAPAMPFEWPSGSFRRRQTGSSRRTGRSEGGLFPGPANDREVFIMKTKLPGVLLACVLLVSGESAGGAVDPAALEKGAAGQADEWRQDFRGYMDQFFRGLVLAESVHEWSGPNEAREKQMLPTKEMKEAASYSPSLLAFIRMHKTDKSDMAADKADKLVMAWYLWTHPASGSSQKFVAHTLLIEVFGEEYGGRKEVEAEIRRMEKDEYQTESRLDGKK